MSNQESALELSFLMGTLLLENGAEITRVQETMEKVAEFYQVETFDVFVISNAIFANGIENGVSHKTRIKYVPSYTIHFGRIAAVNQLSREITSGRYSIQEAYEKALAVKDIPYTSNFVLTIACALGCASFCYMYGGSLIDSIMAIGCGFFLQVFLNAAEKHHMSKFLTNILGSAFSAAMAIALVSFGFGNNSQAIIAGAIIRLVPGMALTTSIRDFLNSDYLSGTIRMIDALLVGVYIAIGVGAVIKISSVFSAAFI